LDLCLRQNDIDEVYQREFYGAFRKCVWFGVCRFEGIGFVLLANKMADAKKKPHSLAIKTRHAKISKKSQAFNHKLDQVPSQSLCTVSCFDINWAEIYAVLCTQSES